MKNGKSTASMVLGIVGIILSLIPVVGLPVNATGLMLGIKARKQRKNKRATAGFVMCIVGLSLTDVNMILGAIFGALECAKRIRIENEI